MLNLGKNYLTRLKNLGGAHPHVPLNLDPLWTILAWSNDYDAHDLYWDPCIMKCISYFRPPMCVRIEVDMSHTLTSIDEFIDPSVNVNKINHLFHLDRSFPVFFRKFGLTKNYRSK